MCIYVSALTTILGKRLTFLFNTYWKFNQLGTSEFWYESLPTFLEVGGRKFLWTWALLYVTFHISYVKKSKLTLFHNYCEIKLNYYVSVSLTELKLHIKLHKWTSEIIFSHTQKKKKKIVLTWLTSRWSPRGGPCQC